MRAHLVRYLGEPSREWRHIWTTMEGARLDVLAFRDRPWPGCWTYASVGLVEYAFNIGQVSRCGELILPLTAALGEAPSVIVAVAAQILAGGVPPDSGLVLGPAGPLFEGTDKECVYLAAPGLYPEAMAEYAGSDGRAVQLWEILPLTAREGRLASQVGPDQFEAILVGSDIDLADPGRAEIDAPLGR